MFNNNALFDLLQQANDDWDDDLAHLMGLDDEITATEFYLDNLCRRKKAFYDSLSMEEKRRRRMCIPSSALSSSGVEVIRLL